MYAILGCALDGVPIALNTIVIFDSSDAMAFVKQNAIAQCNRLNLDEHSLISNGYGEFEVMLNRFLTLSFLVYQDVIS